MRKKGKTTGEGEKVVNYRGETGVRKEKKSWSTTRTKEVIVKRSQVEEGKFGRKQNTHVI